MKLSGNTVLTTGGATGIGLALAQTRRSLSGKDVIISWQRHGRLSAVKEANTALQVRVADVSYRDGMRSM
jgi:uncharacterized oxidoreductase